jgi:hypothetical protein
MTDTDFWDGLLAPRIPDEVDLELHDDDADPGARSESAAAGSPRAPLSSDTDRRLVRLRHHRGREGTEPRSPAVHVQARPTNPKVGGSIASGRTLLSLDLDHDVPVYGTRFNPFPNNTAA